MNKLRIKTTIYCNTCGCTMKRTKSIKVQSDIEKIAIKEAKEKVDTWKESLKNKNCACCQSIINDLAA